MIALRTTIALFLTALAAGAETRVRVVGMESKSESQVLGLVGGRLEHVRNEPAAGSRADDAAFLVRQVLRKDGYADARVDWRVASGAEIVLTVHEGGRLSLGKVVVNGVPAAQAEKLTKIYATPANKDRPIASGTSPFHEEDVETGLSYVRQELNATGYWSAVVTLRSRDLDHATGIVSPVIDIVPGALHRIGVPDISTQDGKGLQETRAAVQPFINRDATTANLNEMRAAAEAVFVSTGYPDAKITMGQVIDSTRFIPQFHIDLGKRVRLHRVNIEGLEKTNPNRVRQRVKGLEGEWYDEAAMSKRVRGFLATGAFSSVRVDTQDVGQEMIDATLHFEEGKAREVTVAGGVDSYQGFILRTTYADRNLFGQLLGFSTGFEFSARGVLGETKITDPWLFGSDAAGTARLFALIYGHEGYTTFETGLEGKVTWKFGDHYGLEFLAASSLVEVTEDGLPISELGETSYSHHRFRVTQTIDFRDSPILPKKGWHVEFPFEIGAAVGNSSTTYAKAGITGGWYHKINDNYEMGAGGEVGLIVPSDEGANLPIDLRYFNGGSRSVRSFPERELGPTVEGYPVGGEAMWNANLELARNINGSLKAVGFLDAGSLRRSLQGEDSGEFEIAAGLGLRLDLPIGPVRLEYGYNLTQDGDEPMGALHFAIGIAF